MKGALLYSLFERYVSLLPEDAKSRNLFYCKPKKKVTRDDMSWYYNIAVGLNLLASRLKDMFMAAGLDSSNINNHGLRASGITRMYSEGLPDKLIMEHSGQFISLGGVQSYKRVRRSKNGVSKEVNTSEIQCSSKALEAIEKILPASTDDDKREQD